MDEPYMDWLRSAYDDLRLIEHIIDDEYLTNMVAFHAQQAIEKSLKSLLEYRQQEVPKIHSLNRLFALIGEDTISFNTDLVNLLDSLYIDARYPGSIGLLPYGKPTIDDARSFYDFAQSVYKKIYEMLVINQNNELSSR